jgi:hypothetical protein
MFPSAAISTEPTFVLATKLEASNLLKVAVPIVEDKLIPVILTVTSVNASSFPVTAFNAIPVTSIVDQ